MSIRVADIASDTTFDTYSPSACAVGPLKTKGTEATKGTAVVANKQKDEFIANEKLYFSPATRGTKTEWKAVECETKSGTCKLVS